MYGKTTEYAMTRRVRDPFPQAVERVRHALGDHGFGIITEIDMMQTFKTKRGIDYHPYVILGACNPEVAHRALEIDQNIGLLLPCNVVVREDVQQPGSVLVTAIDPVVQLGVTGNSMLEPYAEEIRDRLSRVLDTVSPD